MTSVSWCRATVASDSRGTTHMDYTACGNPAHVVGRAQSFQGSELQGRGMVTVGSGNRVMGSRVHVRGPGEPIPW